MAKTQYTYQDFIADVLTLADGGEISVAYDIFIEKAKAAGKALASTSKSKGVSKAKPETLADAQTVLSKLKGGATVSRLSIDWDALRLSTAIRQLEREGHIITSIKSKTETGGALTSYKLEVKNSEVA